MGGIVATGGGDSPEDVLGAIDKTIKLSWKAANKIFYHAGTGNDSHLSYLHYYMDFTIRRIKFITIVI